MSTTENPLIAARPKAKLYYLPRGVPSLPLRVSTALYDLSTNDYVYISSSGLRGGINHPSNHPIVVDGVERHIPFRIAVWLNRFLSRRLDLLFWVDGLCAPEFEFKTITDRHDGVMDIIRHASDIWCLVAEPRSLLLTKKIVNTLELAYCHWLDACAFVGVEMEQPLHTLTTQQKMSIAEWLRKSLPEDLAKIDEYMWWEIENIFHSSYWSSVKCIADIVVGQKVWMLYGGRRMSLTLYMGAFRAFTYLRHEATTRLKPSTTKGWEMAVALYTMRCFNKKWQKVDLRHLLQITRLCVDARGDPRDVINAMAALCMPRERRIELFHNKYLRTQGTIQDVFIEVARYIIGDRQDLSIWD
ncbi:hypothetical protein F4680DRAFT_463436 [Xylaria scruposa]|nr:hypothetical protein F4680DRAFT_463436 [Xylaria scruposa]